MRVLLSQVCLTSHWYIRMGRSLCGSIFRGATLLREDFARRMPWRGVFNWQSVSWWNVSKAFPKSSEVLVWHCKRWGNRSRNDLMQKVRLGLRNNNLCIPHQLPVVASDWVRFQRVISCCCVLSPLVTHLAQHPSPTSTSLWSSPALTAHPTTGECAVYCNHNYHPKITPHISTYHQIVLIIQVFFPKFVVVYYCRRMCSLLLLYIWFLQAFHILHQILLLLFTCCLFVVCSHIFLYFCCCLLAACLLFVPMYYTKVCCCLLVACL